MVAVGWLRPVFRYGVAGLCALLGGQFLYSLFWYGFQQGEYYDTLPWWSACWRQGPSGITALHAAGQGLQGVPGQLEGLGIVLAGCAWSAVCCISTCWVFGKVIVGSQIQTLEIRIADNTYTLTPEKDADLLEQVRASIKR